MTLLFYYKSPEPIRALKRAPIAPPKVRKKRRKTFEIVRTKQKPGDSRAIEALAEGLISELKQAEIERLRAEQLESARIAREARELEAIERYRARLVAELAAAFEAEIRRERQARDDREIRELLEIDEILNVMEMVH